MQTGLIKSALKLRYQYQNETGNFFLSKNGLQEFNNFYQRRNIIGQLIFEQLRRRGYNLTDKRALELFSSIYDSIGINYSTYVIDTNTSTLRTDHQKNLLSQYDKYEVEIHNGNLILNAVEIINSSGRGWRFQHKIAPSNFDHFILLNPRNNQERRIMRELLNSDYNCIVGYYGDEYDANLNAHKTDINILENNTKGTVIPNINVENGYAYILTNRNINKKSKTRKN